MSERQAKLKRKTQEKEEIKKPKNGKKIAIDIAVVLVVAAVAGVGGYASWQTIKANRPTETASADTGETQTQTVATVAESKGTTAEELLAKCGLEDSGLTAESTAQELYAAFTVDGYAKFEDKTSEELKKEYGLEDVKDDELWSEASLKMKMSKVAEIEGKTFEEFAKENSLPAEITADTTYSEAMEIMQNAANTDETKEGE
ncbi:MAG: hypothetical protein PUE13_01560 [Clostridiales bacterium]|nr:hypothetical protein [Clostridiales bacterium]